MSSSNKRRKTTDAEHGIVLRMPDGLEVSLPMGQCTRAGDAVCYMEDAHPLPSNWTHRVSWGGVALRSSGFLSSGKDYSITAQECPLQVWGTPCVFLAQLSSGKVVAWGAAFVCGDISSVKGELEQGTERVWSTFGAFLAQPSSGEAVAWGDAG